MCRRRLLALAIRREFKSSTRFDLFAAEIAQLANDYLRAQDNRSADDSYSDDSLVNALG